VTELILPEPQGDIGRLDLTYLDIRAAGPVGFDPLYNIGLPTDSFRFLMLNGEQVSIADFGQRCLASRRIDLAQSVPQKSEASLGKLPISRPKATPDLLAPLFDPRIIDPV